MDKYFNPVRTYLGAGSLSVLPQLAAELQAQKIMLLLWDEQVLDNASVKEFIVSCGEKVTSMIFSASNPEAYQLFDLYNETKDAAPDLLIAIGGGSVMDVAKALCCLYAKPVGSVEEMCAVISAKTWNEPTCKWIGVPTTAGTGSEVTCWATIWDSANNKKYSVDTDRNYAYAAVVDPVLASTMPIKLAVSSALDAAAHATESYWAKASNLISRSHALKSISLIMEHIDDLLAGKAEAHEYMAQGSMLAGMAFSNTRTTACHSISYPLTMKYHVPHGVAVSMLLAPVMELNLPLLPDKGAELLAAYGVNSVEELRARITDILERSGNIARLQGWGAQAEEIPELVAHSMTKGRADNNPAELNEAIVTKIIQEIF